MEARNIRVSLQRTDHPIIEGLLWSGDDTLFFFGFVNKRFESFFKKRLRWLGSFIITARLNSDLRKIADACYMSCLKELGHDDEYQNAMERRKIDEGLISAIDSFFSIVNPIVRRKHHHINA